MGARQVGRCADLDPELLLAFGRARSFLYTARADEASKLSAMGAMSDSGKARREIIATWGYATPVVCPHVRSSLVAGLVSGASTMLDPFRSSLPSTYHQVPAWLADTVAIRSDWAILGMDYRYVSRNLNDVEGQRQEPLFDPNQLEP